MTRKKPSARKSWKDHFNPEGKEDPKPDRPHPADSKAQFTRADLVERTSKPKPFDGATGTPSVTVIPQVDFVFTKTLGLINEMLQSLEQEKQKNLGRLPLAHANTLEKLTNALVRLSKEEREIDQSARERKYDNEQLLDLIIEDPDVVVALLERLAVRSPQLLLTYARAAGEAHVDPVSD